MPFFVASFFAGSGSFQANVSTSVIALLMAGVILNTYSCPGKSFMVLFNVIFLGFLTLILYAGYSTEDVRIVRDISYDWEA